MGYYEWCRRLEDENLLEEGIDVQIKHGTIIPYKVWVTAVEKYSEEILRKSFCVNKRKEGSWKGYKLEVCCPVCGEVREIELGKGELCNKEKVLSLNLRCKSDFYYANISKGCKFYGELSFTLNNGEVKSGVCNGKEYGYGDNKSVYLAGERVYLRDIAQPRS